jgi:hypothetical protein
VTGLFFENQTVESLMEVIERFEESAHCFPQTDMLANSQKFSKGRFMKLFREFVG